MMVIRVPIDDRIFQELKLSGKSGILLGWRLNPKRCIGVKVKLIPKMLIKKWKLNTFVPVGREIIMVTAVK